MDREPAGVEGAESGASGAMPRRRLAVAGLAAIGILLVAVAVLATRLISAPPTASAQAPAPSPSPSATASLTVPAIYQRVAPSVVAVQAGGGFGTGIIVADDGTIITAAHVVANASAIVVIYADGTLTRATILSSNKQMDIALLTPARLPQIVVPAALGGNTDIGAPVVAIGNPLGLTDSVSAGVVSGLNRSADTDTGKRSGLIQFDASVNPGSSGGPLLNAEGQVIGVNTAIFSQGGGFSGIGFAVPSKIAKEVASQLISRGRVIRGWVGLYAQDLNPALAKHFRSPAPNGALISAIVEHGPADNADLKAGDIILKYNGQPIESAKQLKAMVGHTETGTRASLEMARDGRIKTVKLAIIEQPGVARAQNQRAGRVPSRDPSLGLEIEDIPAELAHYLKITPRNGAIIVGVRPGSAGFDAGLTPGDIILNLNQKEIRGAKDFAQITSKLKSSDTAILYVQHGPDDKTFVPVELRPAS